jgi:AcrR family transcriptional regulator
MTEELKKATKEKIFREAAELFSRDGYHKVSVREICEAAGVTKPVLYYYFGDKENLLFEMMRDTREYPYLLKFSAFIQFMAIPDKVKNYKYETAQKDWVRVIALFSEAQKNGELKSDIDIKIAAKNYIGSIIVILTDYLMGHIIFDEFCTELYDFLEFWKKQFVIEKK